MNECKRYLVVTLDTEPDCDIRWKRSDPLTFSSITIGIPQILRPIWNEYAINPVYFVSPEVIENDACIKILKKEADLGAEIGAHLHPEYIEPEKKYTNYEGTETQEYACSTYSNEIECKKIENLTKLIIKNLETRPVSYRAGKYGADLATIQTLEKLGYKIDSSVTPGIDWSAWGGPNHSKALHQPYHISKENYYVQSEKENSIGILEVPITIYDKRLGPFGKLLPNTWHFYSCLRPTYMSVFEEKLLVRKMIRQHKDVDKLVLNLMFHPMEIMPRRTPFVKSKFGQRLYVRRLKKTLNYLKRKQFRSKTLAQ